MLIGLFLLVMWWFNGDPSAVPLAAPPAAYEKAIDDPAREAEVLAIRTAMESAYQSGGDAIRQRYHELARLHAGHDTPASAFETFGRDMDQRQAALQKRLIEDRFRLREHMTREEWKKVYGGGD